MTTFGPFRLDAVNQRIYCGSAETQLSHKAAAILEILTKRPNQIVTHEELLDSAWRGIHVQPEVLKVYIAELRRALKDSADNPRYIQTVHRRGYRLVASPGPLHQRRYGSEHVVGRSAELAILSRLQRKAAA